MLRDGLLLRLEKLPDELRDGLLLRLETLLDELRDGLLLRLETLPDELRLEKPPPELRLETPELLWLLRLDPPWLRWARAGVLASTRAARTRVIAFEVFIMLLLSCLLFVFLFSAAKVQQKRQGKSPRTT